MSNRLALPLFALLISATCLGLVSSGPVSSARAEEGFQSLFDGKTLKGWDGDPDFWSVKDGALTGQTTPDNPTKGNTFLVYRGGELGDFELRLEFRIVGGNSGIQYRSKEVSKWVIGGYQADFDAAGGWTGTLYEEKGRAILAKRGNKVVITAKGEKKTVGATTDEKKILDSIKKEDWNEYTIIAKGNHLVHIVNGNVTIDVTDEQTEKAAKSGLLALQLHAGPPMQVQFKNLRYKPLGNTKTSAVSGAKKKIAFMAGTRSHGYGAHEHFAGSALLARSLQVALPQFDVQVYRDGWPKDPSVFDDADVLVMYCDGGGRHPANQNLQQIDRLAKKGVGIVCIHYGVEVPKGEPGDRFLDWIGGYFETHWSVNPHWTAEFKELPKHPITRGVKPFSANDEWYYHMRFRPEMKGVTPILTAVPPKSTLSRPDGAHSGNPHVRAKAGQPQHVAWAAERPDGGRGFGFTGGHFHWNWGNPDFRKTVLNAIVWCAKEEVPEGGVADKPVGLPELLENQDFPKPGNFDEAKIRDAFKLSGTAPAATRGPAAKPIYSSPVVTTRTPGHRVEIKAALGDARQLFLVVQDGGNGYGCDWADWIEPRLVGPQGEKKLTELKWKSASSDWGQVRINRSAGDSPLRVNGKSVSYGIGTHANSLIAFDLPPGYTHFHAHGGLDNGGSDQGNCGGEASIQFQVYTQRPRLPAGSSSNVAASREPDDAVAGLDVADGLEATLFAAEPKVRSLTNLDVDHRGRVWVCEVMNYRRHNGKRPEGDRILILEDTDGDGVSDSSKVFYQGRDIDSAMGICVLGNRVIVSCSPTVWVFTDEDGDDRPDKKEALFTKTGQPQHDHSAHSFIFGPDGKLYWNFGNTGKAVYDANGAPVVDLAGNQVIDNGKPYLGGMPFRCNLDGSEFEVLAHNFRNNYEVTVDSFGSLWQSDNDDDGNRGVRINFVMEFGNYGYRDEITGDTWKTPRTNMEAEIPLRHWHLNDPGVVPNLLQTGAGSPTGITVYEGRLLPKVFWDQVIHCDAGPNVVRAYPVKQEGAGYSAEMVNVLHGARDNWFRPADVCVAPDGSLFVTDWYDPGVGGHAQGDLDRGRIFRIAPPKHKYQVDAFDFDTTAGAIEALKNPNLAVRYLAWTALHKQGKQAEPALLKVLDDEPNARIRARALWLLGKIDGRGEHYVQRALEDDDANIRIVGVRLARQLKLPTSQFVKPLLSDASSAVLRECAIALRLDKSEQAASLWAELAMRYDGKDRWLLEALGIAAEGQWDRFLSAWMQRVGQWDTPAGRDIIWRSRGSESPIWLARIAAESKLDDDQLARFMRAFDFQDKAAREPVLLGLAMSPPRPDSNRMRYVSAEALKRIDKIDTKNNPQHAAALSRLLDQVAGTPQFVDLVDRFGIEQRYPELLELAAKNPANELGIQAIRTLLAKKQWNVITRALRGDVEMALPIVQVMGNSADGRIVGMLMPLVEDKKADAELRRQATSAVAKTVNGAEQLIAMARQGKFDPSLKSAAAFHLHNVPRRAVQAAAAELFPLPAASNTPLPSMEQLLAKKGNAAEGQVVFNKQGKCATCHLVNKQGKEVGPDLSEIGSKLSRKAFFESILYPSAGISHNYETYTAELDSGNVVTGLMVNQTPDAVTLKSADGISRTFKRSEIEVLKRQPTSLMPADLQKTMTLEDLVNVVDYLGTLKKK